MALLMDSDEALENFTKIYKKLLHDQEETEKAFQHASEQKQKHYELLKEIAGNSYRFPSQMHFQQAMANVKAIMASHQVTASELQHKAAKLVAMQKYLEEQAAVYAHQRMMQERAKQIESMKARQRIHAELVNLDRFLESLVAERNVTIERLRNIEEMVQNVAARKRQILEMHGIVVHRTTDAEGDTIPEDANEEKAGGSGGDDNAKEAEQNGSIAKMDKSTDQETPKSTT